MLRVLRIIYVLSEVLVGSRDGSLAGRVHVRGICNGLASLGHRITLVMPRGQPVSELNRAIEVQTVSVPTGNRLWPYLFYLRARSVLKQLCEREKVDILYTRGTYLEVLLAWQLKRWYGVRYVPEINGIYSEDMAGAFLKRAAIARVERWRNQLADGMIAVTSGLQDYLIRQHQIPQERLTVISNGADTSLLPIPKEEAQKTLGLPGNRIYLSMVLSFKPWHDVEVVLRALVALPQELRERFHLLLVGEGPLRAALEQCVKGYGIEAVVSFVGYKRPDEVRHYISASDIGLVLLGLDNSKRRGVAPLKFFESLACARPVIVTDVAEMNVIVRNHRIGWVVPPDDVKCMRQVLAECLDRQSELPIMGERARFVAQNHYSWQSLAEQTSTFLLRIATVGVSPPS